MKLNPVNMISPIQKRNSASIEYKKLLYEDEIDEFVSSLIKKERDKTGTIYNYREELNSNEIKNSKDEYENSLQSFVLNDKMHFIKFGEKAGEFIDVIKKLELF